MSWFDRIKKLLKKDEEIVEQALVLVEEKEVEVKSKIVIERFHNRRYSFNNYAKNILDLPNKHEETFSVVKATQVLNSSFVGKPWKKQIGVACTEDLVKAAAIAYGVLEGRDYYFKRNITRDKDQLVITVLLFVLDNK